MAVRSGEKSGAEGNSAPWQLLCLRAKVLGRFFRQLCPPTSGGSEAASQASGEKVGLDSSPHPVACREKNYKTQEAPRRRANHGPEQGRFLRRAGGRDFRSLWELVICLCLVALFGSGSHGRGLACTSRAGAELGVRPSAAVTPLLTGKGWQPPEAVAPTSASARPDRAWPTGSRDGGGAGERTVVREGSLARRRPRQPPDPACSRPFMWSSVVASLPGLPSRWEISPPPPSAGPDPAPRSPADL